MTRAEFAAAIRGLLTDDQRRQIRDLFEEEPRDLQRDRVGRGAGTPSTTR